MTEFVRIVSLCLTIHSHDLKLSNNVTELLLPGPSFPPIFPHPLTASSATPPEITEM